MKTYTRSLLLIFCFALFWQDAYCGRLDALKAHKHTILVGSIGLLALSGLTEVAQRFFVRRQIEQLKKRRQRSQNAAERKDIAWWLNFWQKLDIGASCVKWPALVVGIAGCGTYAVIKMSGPAPDVSTKLFDRLERVNMYGAYKVWEGSEIKSVYDEKKVPKRSKVFEGKFEIYKDNKKIATITGDTTNPLTLRNWRSTIQKAACGWDSAKKVYKDTPVSTLLKSLEETMRNYNSKVEHGNLVAKVGTFEFDYSVS